MRAATLDFASAPPALGTIGPFGGPAAALRTSGAGEADDEVQHERERRRDRRVGQDRRHQVQRLDAGRARSEDDAVAVPAGRRAERSVRNYDTIVRRLIAERRPEDEAVGALVTFEALIIGSALDAAAPDDIMAPGDAGAGSPAFAAAERARTAAASARGIRPTDRSFALGVRALLRGLRAEWPRG